MSDSGVGVFRTILWKEFREGLKWAAASMLVASVSLIYVILNATSDSGDSIMDIFTSITVFAPFSALMIGLAQVIPENKGDRWSFLAHRPVRRSTLFWGKAIAGTLLYLASIGVPLACATGWVATPGHLPMPFDPRMVLPGIADLLCGLIYYFAGLFIGMRDARWYVSRAMGIGVGIVCTALVLVVPTFWQAAASSVAGLLLIGAAAWGTFVAGGQYESQPRLTRAAVALSVGSGLLVVGFLAGNLILSVLPGQNRDTQTIVHALTTDGTIVQTVRLNNQTAKVNDLEGRPIDRYNDAAARQNLAAGVIVAESRINPDWQRVWPSSYRAASHHFVQFPMQTVASSAGETVPGETVHWYYVYRLGLIAAYDSRSARLVGWLGPDGFTSGDTKPAHRFEGPLQNGSEPNRLSLLTFPKAVYRLDLRLRTIDKIFDAPAGESVLGAAEWTSIAFGERGRFDFIVTTKNVYLRSLDGTPQLTVPVDPQAAGYGILAVYRATRAPGTPTFLWYYPSPWAWSTLPQQVSKFENNNPAGYDYSLVNHTTLPPVRTTSETMWAHLLVPSPVIPVTVPLGIKLAALTADGNPGLPTILNAVEWSQTQQFLLWFIPTLVSLLSAVVAFARARAYAFPKRRLWLWTVLGFLLGPLAVVVMLSLVEWPVRETCPSCGRQRVVTRERCEHCNEPFAPPPADGTEIFEDMRIVAR